MPTAGAWVPSSVSSSPDHMTPWGNNFMASGYFQAGDYTPSDAANATEFSTVFEAPVPVGGFTDDTYTPVLSDFNLYQADGGPIGFTMESGGATVFGTGVVGVDTFFATQPETTNNVMYPDVFPTPDGATGFQYEDGESEILINTGKAVDLTSPYYQAAVPLTAVLRVAYIHYVANKTADEILQTFAVSFLPASYVTARETISVTRTLGGRSTTVFNTSTGVAVPSTTATHDYTRSLIVPSLATPLNGTTLGSLASASTLPYWSILSSAPYESFPDNYRYKEVDIVIPLSAFTDDRAYLVFFPTAMIAPPVAGADPLDTSLQIISMALRVNYQPRMKVRFLFGDPVLEQNLRNRRIAFTPVS